MEELNLFFAFGAGFLSFLSPCTLPLYPAFLSYITGVSTSELNQSKGIRNNKALLHTILFLVGFSIIFLALGLSTSYFSTLFTEYKDLLRQLGAIVIVFFGLIATGLLKIEFLQSEKKIHFTRRPTGYFGSVLIGMGFAAGWTPCTGPILAGVITLGVSNPGMGLFYMAAYCLGFSVPFLFMSFFIEKVSFIKQYSQLFMKVGGVIMIIMGIFLYFDWMTKIISFLTNNVFGGFTGF